MKEYIQWLERMIEQTREDKDLQREHWAFCQSLKKVRKLALHQCNVSGQSEQLEAFNEVFQIAWELVQEESDYIRLLKIKESL